MLTVGLLLGALVGICPPRVQKEAPAVVASRGCLFSNQLYRHQSYDLVTKRGTSTTLYALDYGRLTIEWAVLGMAVAATIVACRTWKEKNA